MRCLTPKHCGSYMGDFTEPSGQPGVAAAVINNTSVLLMGKLEP